jgi:hypothetical protein
MKQGARGRIVKRMLSGVALIGLLSLFVVQGWAKTEVYSVNPVSASQSGQTASEVWQSAVATCSSIQDTVFLFNGAPRLSGSFALYIQDSSGGGPVGPFLAPPDSVGYRWIKFPVNTTVTRGKTYYFKFSHPSGINYFYAPGTTYGYGRLYLSGSPDQTKDLCCRVIGKNNPPDSAFWGVNGNLSTIWGDVTRDSATTQAKGMGINITREQIEWATFKPFKDSVYHWARPDSGIDKAKNKGLRVMIDFFGTPFWAATTPSDSPSTAAWHYPPINMDKTLGDTANYLWQFACSLATHYSLKGVHDYEIWNEMNFYDWFRYGIGEDSVYYGHKGYDRDSSGRAKLYVLACNVARDAITKADPNAKIYTNAVLLVNLIGTNGRDIPGKNWMRTYYNKGGKGVADVITWHWYNDADSSRHKFEPCRFIVDYDTLRQVMREGGEGDKVVWADEGGYGDTMRIGTSYCTEWSVDRAKQADIAVQVFATGLGQQENPQGPALGQVNWFMLYNTYSDTLAQDTCWVEHAGLLGKWNQSTNTFPNKPSSYAFRQMTQKLKSLNFNRRVPRPDTNVYAYEFQIPGPDTTLRTWCLWRAAGARNETLSVRTNVAWLVTRDTIGAADSSQVPLLSDGSGKVFIDNTKMDNVPRYLDEYGAVSRPDIIIDSLWIYPDTARAGDKVWFYARLRNIGNDSLRATITNLVTFQVDGVSKKFYQASRGLAPLKTPRDPLDTLTVGAGSYSIPDWNATWGDHLIKAWVDSSDKYVELREDNNMGYIFKHMKPTGKVIIRSTGYNQGYPTTGRKFTNTRYDTLWMQSNGGTTPHADSMRIKNGSGSWKPWRRDSTYWLDTLTTGDEKKWVYAQFKMVPSETSARVADSVILDMTLPVAQISTPTNGQTVSGTVPFWGVANDSGYPPRYFRVDTLRYYRNSGTHDTIHVSWTSIGSKAKQVATGLLGNWNTTLVPNSPPAYKETLAVWDSAGNYNCKTIDLNVLNSITDGGASWATGFGTYSSPVMNVATDPGGNVYFAETQNSKIRKYSPRKDSLFAFSARRSDSTGLNWAVGMVLKDSTTLYVADGYNHCVKAFDRQGNLLLRFGSFGQEPGQFKQPCGIALDHKGRLFVVDRLNHRVQVFSDSSGSFLFQFGSQGADSGRFNSPTGIAYVPRDTALELTQDLVYVSDTRNNQIQVFDSLGNWVKTIKQPDSLGFDTPTGICADKWGDIYIADTKHNRIVELNPYGERIFDFGGLGDSLWQFRSPVGVSSSPGAHYLYVADMGNRRVQRFTVILVDSSGGGPQSGEIVFRIPLVYSLAQSHPNPTTGEALIEYGLPQESPVRLTVYNVAGQVVKEYKPGKQEAAFYTHKWDGRSNLNHKVGAGVYFYRLEAGNWVKTRKMVVLR